MADIPGPSTLVLQDENCNKENLDTNFEPERKKLKTEINLKEKDNKLEDRLSGILCCAVCLDLPRTCFQVLAAKYCIIIKETKIAMLRLRNI